MGVERKCQEEEHPAKPVSGGIPLAPQLHGFFPKAAAAAWELFKVLAPYFEALLCLFLGGDEGSLLKALSVPVFPR